MNKIKVIWAIVILGTTVFSCGSDDEGAQGVNCNDSIDQTASGTFRGEDFTVQGGTYRSQFGEYFCRIYVSDVTDGDCSFPRFGGNEGSILFSLPNLDPQTLSFSDEAGQGVTLNFNSIETTENSVVTIVELAECGQLEILSNTTTTVSGRVVAKGQDGSSINGNFVLTLCDD